jgi:predicted DNA-binding ribbon-helix-helix protein
MSSIKKHSVLHSGRRTSVSLEDEFYDQLKVIAERRAIPIGKVVEEIETSSLGGNLSNHIRLFVLRDVLSRNDQPRIVDMV